MADFLCANRPVLVGSISLPLAGAWMAHVELDASGSTTELLDDTAPITLTLGGVSYLGTVRRQGVYAGRLNAEIVGGYGGLSTPIAPRAYQGVPVSIPLSDALFEGGETLSITVDAAVKNTLLPRWSRTAGTVGTAIDRIASELALGWRVLSDGSLWIGAETWSEVTIDHDLTDQNLASDTVVIASEAPSVVPGSTFRGRRVSTVVHDISPEMMRTTVHFASSNVDRSRAAFESLVQGVTARYDYHGAYRCKVIAQNDDGTLELKPEGSRMPPTSRVPIRHGIPGVDVTVNDGAMVLLEFEDGDPRHPIATLWDTASVKAITVTAKEVHVNAETVELGKGGRPIARHGDLVRVGGLGLAVSFVTPLPVPGVPPTPLLSGTPYPIFFIMPGAPLPSSSLPGQISSFSANKST